MAASAGSPARFAARQGRVFCDSFDVAHENAACAVCDCCLQCKPRLFPRCNGLHTFRYTLLDFPVGLRALIENEPESKYSDLCATFPIVSDIWRTERCADHKAGRCDMCNGCKKCPPRKVCNGRGHTGTINGGVRGGRGVSISTGADPNVSTGTARVPNAPNCADVPLSIREFAEADPQDLELSAMFTALKVDVDRKRPFTRGDLQPRKITVSVPLGHCRSEEVDVDIGHKIFREALAVADRCLKGAMEILAPGAGDILFEHAIAKHYREGESDATLAGQNRVLAELALTAHDSHTRNLCTGVLLEQLTEVGTQALLYDVRKTLKKYNKMNAPRNKHGGIGGHGAKRFRSARECIKRCLTGAPPRTASYSNRISRNPLREAILFLLDHLEGVKAGHTRFVKVKADGVKIEKGAPKRKVGGCVSVAS